ncbi:hypothetical protein OC844_002387 [Tilletia horrida]|nr:hypothetical protein OC844_002387 [Tilletia horrida]
MTGPNQSQLLLNNHNHHKLFAFRQPAEAAGTWTSMRTRMLPVPAQLSSLRSSAALFFPPPRFYEIALGYCTQAHLAAGRTELEIMMLDAIDIDPFSEALATGMLPSPIIINVHHVRFNKLGEIIAEKIGKTVYEPSRVGAHLKFDDRSKPKAYLSKVEQVDLSLAEHKAVGGGNASNGGGGDSSNNADADADADADGDDDMPQWFAPSGSSAQRRATYGPSSSTPSAAAPAALRAGPSTGTSSGSNVRGPAATAGPSAPAIHRPAPSTPIYGTVAGATAAVYASASYHTQAIRSNGLVAAAQQGDVPMRGVPGSSPFSSARAQGQP